MINIALEREASGAASTGKHAENAPQKRDTARQLIAAVSHEVKGDEQRLRLRDLLIELDAYFSRKGILQGFTYTVDDLGLIAAVSDFMSTDEYENLSAEQQTELKVFLRNLMDQVRDRGLASSRGNQLEELVATLAEKAVDLSENGFVYCISDNDLAYAYMDLQFEQPVRALRFANALATGVCDLVYPHNDEFAFFVGAWKREVVKMSEALRGVARTGAKDLIGKLLPSKGTPREAVQSVRAEAQVVQLQISSLIQLYVEAIIPANREDELELLVLQKFHIIAALVPKLDSYRIIGYLREYQQNMKPTIASYIGDELAEKIFYQRPKEYYI
ncbi:hypothetical protein KA012_02820 [Candidatus Woesebacteria bacterium]|nr:hypothetical protein [Candidatus Woesebacteria bacterium]